MKKLTYYCDMDGVLADFMAVENALERFTIEKDFFKMLPPINENIEAIKLLISKGEKVKILSASPNKNADHSKKIWLSRHLPEVKKKDIIIVRNGAEKIAKVPKHKRKYAVLFDDYGKNLREWVVKGGKVGIKVLGKSPYKENREYLQIKNIMEWVKL